MDLSREEQQRKEFCDILFELAKSQEKFQDAYYRAGMYKRLEALYDAPFPEKRFRHFYSDIFSVLTQIQQNPSLGDTNILGQNLSVIRSGYHPKNKAGDGKRIIDVSDALKKLYDHVNLDIARISYSDAGDRKISGEEAVTALQAQVKGIQTDVEKAQRVNADLKKTETKIAEVENKLDNSQKEYITILGIFAAVVLAFTGGIAFSTSVLNNIARADIYRVLLTALTIGLVLINVLFGLFYYIDRLVNKSPSIKPLIISNIIIAVFLSLIIAAWNIGLVESRDQRIHNISTNTSAIETAPVEETETIEQDN